MTDRRHKAWETAMGLGDYIGSPAEQDDRANGIKIGGRVFWVAEGSPIATITSRRIDENGDPMFTLEFEDDHKPVEAGRTEVGNLAFRPRSSREPG